LGVDPKKYAYGKAKKSEGAGGADDEAENVPMYQAMLQADK